MKTSAVILILLLVSVALAQDKTKKVSTEFYDTKYSIAADPYVQLEQAKELARAENKLILLDVGGEWCIWCHRLDDLFRSNQDLAAYLKEQYVPLKVNVSLENRNEDFLGQFPAVEGYPHIFVLDAEGTLVHSQNTGDLEEGKGHSKEKVMTFLKKWAEGKQRI